MNEATEDYQTDAVTSVAQCLTAIEDMAERLLTQAVNKANDRELPGGAAMVALAHVANHEAWANMLDTAERLAERPEDYPHVDDDDEWEPPLQTLTFWSEKWRRANGNEYDMRPSIGSEANYLRYSLDWAREHEPLWSRFVSDMHAARSRLENVLTEGRRDIVSDDVACLLCDTPLRRRMTAEGYEDEWWCRSCYKHLTGPEFHFATAEAARRALGLPS